MEQKIRVGAVSYLNTKPLVYGFEKGMMKNEVELMFEYPAKIATQLMYDEIVIGLIPVAVIPKLKEHYILSDYCIGAVGNVASVCLFSHVPLHEITHVLFDYQSRTSAALLKILLREHWHISPIEVDTSENYQQYIQGTTAGLVIGDRALQQRKLSPYIYDLAEEWKKMTGLPFLFAAWVANKKLPDDFIERFNKATGEGIQHLDEIAATHAIEAYSLHTYFHQNINYHLDEAKKKAMQLFLKKITS